jgi:hypothetical protein
MKKLLLLVTGMLLFTSAWAETDLSTLLNKVTFPLKVQQWVTTKTAEVYVGVNASVTDAGIEKIQNQVLAQLQQLSNQGEWHIISYTRQQDKSGLESIQISAMARLPQPELVNLRGKAKSMSRPGNTYTIDDVRFTPSDDEITQANVMMRGMIYQQAKSEIDALNKMYPEQKYYLYHIDFNAQPIVMPMMEMATARNQIAYAAAPLKVGNKMELYANVTVASMPDMLTKKPLIN